jgi:hypothetical protein
VIAQVRFFGRSGNHVVTNSAGRAGAAASATDSPNDFFIADRKIDDGIERKIFLAKQGIEGNRLRIRSRVAIKDEFFGPIGAAKQFRNQIVHDDIGNEQPLLNNRFDFPAHGRFQANRFAEDFTCTNVSEPQPVAQPFGLRAFSTSGGTHEHQAHEYTRRHQYWKRITGLSFSKPYVDGGKGATGRNDFLVGSAGGLRTPTSSCWMEGLQFLDIHLTNRAVQPSEADQHHYGSADE